MVLLIDERPKSDRHAAQRERQSSPRHRRTGHPHVQVAEMVIEKAKSSSNTKRTTYPFGGDHRQARAYNTVFRLPARCSPAARFKPLHKPKRFFGAARNIETAALSHLSTALIDTGSRMDEVIFEEYKAPATVLHLDRRIADRRIFPRSPDPLGHAQGRTADSQGQPQPDLDSAPSPAGNESGGRHGIHHQQDPQDGNEQGIPGIHELVTGSDARPLQ